MPHTDTSKSQATNRTSYHASHRCQQITGNKSYILQCFIKIPENSRQPNVHFTMHHTSHRYQQITGNKSYILSCLTQIPANHRQQLVLLTMPHRDTSKSHATNLTSYNASYRYQKITGHLANKSYILPCLTLIAANHSQQVVLLALPHTDTSESQAANGKSCHASRRYQQITGNKSYIIPCITQTLANHRQQTVRLTMPHTDSSKSGHSQQIVHLAMPHTDTSKSQATNRTSCHASHRYLQITGSKSCF